MTQHDDARASTFDLLVLHDDRIAFHGVYASPAERLTCLIKQFPVLDQERRIDRHQVLAAHHQLVGEHPDIAMNAVSKICRKAGYSIFVSTIGKIDEPASVRPVPVGAAPVEGATVTAIRPARLFSVITQYHAPNKAETIAEHFLSRAVRLQSLSARADLAITNPDVIPEHAWTDELQLAKIVEVAIAPATVTLAESTWRDEEQSYLPVPRLAVL
jgi:hypothetical protein